MAGKLIAHCVHCARVKRAEHPNLCIKMPSTGVETADARQPLGFRKYLFCDFAVIFL